MADERYAWLDQDAAERLLRGEPVDTAGEQGGVQAERLARALREAAGGSRPGDLELPGEAAALAAFRQAGPPAGSGRAGRGVRDAAATDGAAASGRSGSVVATVRLARGAGAEHTPGRGRARRWGIDAVMAGCALCGLAVAMGTAAVLPTPFADDTAPLPARSVSGAKTPGPDSGPDGRPDSGQDAVLPAPGLTGAEEIPATRPPSPAGRGPQPGGASQDGASTDGASRDGASRDGASTEHTGTDSPGADHAGAGKAGEGQAEAVGKYGRAWRKQYLIAVEDCRDHRAGRIEPHREEALDAARGGLDVEEFCDRLLGGKDGHPGHHGGDSRGPGDQGTDAGLGEAGTGDPGHGPPDGGPSPAVSGSPMILLPPAEPTDPTPAGTGEPPAGTGEPPG